MLPATRNTRLALSAINGLVTGAIAAAIYGATTAPANEFWPGVKFHPLNYAAMILLCGVNTWVFFAWLLAGRPVRVWKGILMGLVVAVLGSFLCSLVMGLGTGMIVNLLGATLFFIPVSALVGGMAGLILALLLRGSGTGHGG